VPNLPILERNIIHGLACDESEKAFLRALERIDTFSAERFAYEHRTVYHATLTMLGLAAANYGLERAPDGLLKFLMDRHWFLRFPKARAA
jgi:hypothetical protein